MKDQDNMHRVSNRVSSNRTAVFEAKITHWYEDEAKSRQESSGRHQKTVAVELQNWEDLYTIPDTAKLLQTLHRVPFYRYMIRYLVYTFNKELEKEAERQGMDCSQGWEERYAGCLISEREREAASGRLRYLTELVWNAFLKNGCKAVGRTEKIRGNLKGTQKWDREDLETVLYGERISTGNFFMLAFGLHMTYEDLTLFLQKVLKRSKLNLWNVDEFLIYICFHWIKGDRMAFYQWGKENWETVPAKERIFSAPKQTAVIQTELDHILQGLEQTESQESLEDISEAASDVLAGYKYLIERKGDYRRTALKCAGQRLGEFKELCQEDMEEYLFSFKEEQKYAHGNVRVVYDAEQGIRIPAGTRFSQNVKNKDGRQETVWYTALETVSEEPLQELELDINVICTEATAKHAKNKENIGYLPNKAVLETNLDGILEATAFHAIAKPVKKKTDPENDYHVTGVVRIVCVPGTIIAEGTPFYAGGYTYLAAKKTVCEAVAEVPVKCEKEDWEATINQVQVCESSLKGLKRVGNTKISLRSAKDEEENRIGGSLYRYLYTPSEDLICGDNSISDKNAEYLPEILDGTMFSATKLWQIEKQKEIEITRNDILTLSFLAQMAEIEFDQSEYMEIQANANEADTIRQELFEERYADFLIQTNRDLTTCGFQGLYLADPYDCMLAYLTTCSEPLTAFRNLWAVYLDYQKNRQL